MITLFELHWSHYCEKVRLALDFMGLAWRTVQINAFRKDELRRFPRPEHLPGYTVPAVLDESTGRFVIDSTPILRYLAETYPAAPLLFPGDERNRAAIDSKLLELDSQLGIAARRVGYTQIILECPSLLSDLFLGRRSRGLLCLPHARKIAGTVLGMILTRRFDLHKSESVGLYEALEAYLLKLAEELAGRSFVVGESFSAADLALAAQLRPLIIVPFFAEHAQLRPLFDRRREILQRHGRKRELAYETEIARARRVQPPVRRKLRQFRAVLPFLPVDRLAANDQRPVVSWGLATILFDYFVTLRRSKVRQRLATESAR